MFKCANPECTRTTPLEIDSHRADVPDGTAPDRVHRTSDGNSEFSISCPQCGHFTVVTPYRG
jgi:hypothetical protein